MRVRVDPSSLEGIDVGAGIREVTTTKGTFGEDLVERILEEVGVPYERPADYNAPFDFIVRGRYGLEVRTRIDRGKEKQRSDRQRVKGYEKVELERRRKMAKERELVPVTVAVFLADETTAEFGVLFRKGLKGYSYARMDSFAWFFSWMLLPCADEIVLP